VEGGRGRRSDAGLACVGMAWPNFGLDGFGFLISRFSLTLLPFEVTGPYGMPHILSSLLQRIECPRVFQRWFREMMPLPR